MVEALRVGSDEELMRAYQQGDEAAFGELYRRYSPKVYGYLRGSLKDETMADDVFQTTFVKLHKTRDRFDERCSFAAWLFTICRSVMVDALRKKKRSHEDLNPLAIELAVGPVAAESGGAVGELPLQALPAIQREAVELRFVGELSFEDIARRLETSPANARQLVSRGVRKLKDVMKRGGGSHV